MNEGDIVTLTGSFVDPIDTDSHTFDWHVVASNGQSIPDGHGPTFSFSPGNAGTYTVTFTVSDQNGGTAKRGRARYVSSGRAGSHCTRRATESR